MSTNNQFDHLVQHAKEYVETRTELSKLQLIEKSSRVGSDLTAGFSLLLFGALVVMMLSIACALFIGEWYGRNSIGFLIIGSLYTIAGIITYVFRDKLIKRPVQNGIIRSILKDHE